MSATLRRIDRGHFCHGDTRELSVRYEGAYLRLSIAQAFALVELLPVGSRLAESLRTDAACALREDHGISWERACALVAVEVVTATMPRDPAIGLHATVGLRAMYGPAFPLVSFDTGRVHGPLTLRAMLGAGSDTGAGSRILAERIADR